MKKPLLSLLRFYQSCISPCLQPRCRFLPTCSAYAEEAIRRHGAWRGLVLVCGRLLRCHPFCRGGFDEVPAKFSLWP